MNTNTIPGGSMTLDELYATYARYVHRRAAYLVRADMVDDLTQLVWLKAWLHLEQLRPGNVKAWLYRITTNTAYDMWRSVLAEREHTPCTIEGYLRAHDLEEWHAIDESNGDPQESVPEQEHIRRAWANVPPEYQADIRAYACGGKPAKQRVYRAREHFWRAYHRIEQEVAV